MWRKCGEKFFTKKELREELMNLCFLDNYVFPFCVSFVDVFTVIKRKWKYDRLLLNDWYNLQVSEYTCVSQ